MESGNQISSSEWRVGTRYLVHSGEGRTKYLVHSGEGKLDIRFTMWRGGTRYQVHSVEDISADELVE